jgi:SAM-dependent methyltransferase
MKIANEILNILAECKVEGNVVFLPGEQLDRKTYEAVNKCLSSIGGKWNRKAKGHVFDYEPAEALENLVSTGETEDMKKKFQFFPTPRPTAEMMCDMAELDTYSKVLEPECGKGDLADAIYDRGVAEVFGVELNRDMDKYLKEKPYTTMTGIDFLEFAEEVKAGKIRSPWTHIIMNPPFSKQQDVSHIWAAYSILKPGGILVSVVSPSPFFRTNKTSVDFQRWLEEVDAEVIDIPEGAFKTSGTMVKTKIIKIKKA